MELFLIITIVALLAWVNGANDIAKGIATLVGNGTTRARHAVLWGTLWTMLGGLAALIWGAALIKNFSSGYLATAFVVDDPFILSSIAGAAAWVVLATRYGLPVSTTHALLGGLVGAALIGGGRAALRFDAITSKALAPLLLGPLLAIGVTSLCILMFRAGQKRAVSDANRHGHQPDEGGRVWISLHWLTSGITSFARGLNDTPKIAAFLILALSLSPQMNTAISPGNGIWPILLVTLVMGMGCLWGGFKVLDRLAYQITTLSHNNGVIANAGTSFLVLAASPLGLPVSTTHVSSGALMGIRWTERLKPRKMDALGIILFGWVITLPVAAIVAAITLTLIQTFHGA